jgi:formylglycine-generating enzyme required for sulfatase activity
LVLAVIGPDWLGATDDYGTRLQSPRDFVRIEIESALHHGVPVLPILVGKASMPPEELLPEGLKPLAFVQALQVRPGRDFHQDVDNVMRAVADLTGGRPRSAAVKPGDIHTTGIGIREVLLPAGAFLMGSPDSDGNASDDEKPQRQVRISSPFLMSIAPITQEEFELLVAYNPSKHLGEKRGPVETVSLADAAEFCNALSQSEGFLPYYEIRGQLVAAAGGPGYRLPRESEWEYACRAGTISRWSFGDDEREVGKYAWYEANSADCTHPVASKLPNPWGLHDMHGNIWELCWDLLVEGGVATAPPAMAPPSECILRGGCFVDPPWALRAANRSSVRVAVRSNRVGFRVVRSSAAAA